MRLLYLDTKWQKHGVRRRITKKKTYTINTCCVWRAIIIVTHTQTHRRVYHIWQILLCVCGVSVLSQNVSGLHGLAKWSNIHLWNVNILSFKSARIFFTFIKDIFIINVEFFIYELSILEQFFCLDWPLYESHGTWETNLVVSQSAIQVCFRIQLFR